MSVGVAYARSVIPSEDREKDDFYPTPVPATLALLRGETFGPRIWEPACGDGAISSVLQAAGHDVCSTDLIERGYGTSGVDFLATTALLAPAIVTNPPYKLAEAFVHHALDMRAEKVAMLLRLAWLEGEGRRKRVFDVRPPVRVWVLSARPTLWHGTDPNARDTGGATSYAWFVWEHGPVSPTTVGWLSKAAGERSLA